MVKGRHDFYKRAKSEINITKITNKGNIVCWESNCKIASYNSGTPHSYTKCIMNRISSDTCCIDIIICFYHIIILAIKSYLREITSPMVSNFPQQA